jgi:hypothetical protein
MSCPVLQVFDDKEMMNAVPEFGLNISGKTTGILSGFRQHPLNQ